MIVRSHKLCSALIIKKQMTKKSFLIFYTNMVKIWIVLRYFPKFSGIWNPDQMLPNKANTKSENSHIFPISPFFSGVYSAFSFLQRDILPHPHFLITIFFLKFPRALSLFPTWYSSWQPYYLREEDNASNFPFFHVIFFHAALI